MSPRGSLVQVPSWKRGPTPIFVVMLDVLNAGGATQADAFRRNDENKASPGQEAA